MTAFDVLTPYYSEMFVALCVGVLAFLLQVIRSGGDMVEAAAVDRKNEVLHQQNQIDVERIKEQLQAELYRFLMDFTDKQTAKSDKMTDLALEQSKQLVLAGQRINDRDQKIAELEKDRIGYRSTMDDQFKRIETLEHQVKALQTAQAKLTVELDHVQKEADLLRDRLNKTLEELKMALSELELERTRRIEAERVRDELLGRRDNTTIEIEDAREGLANEAL